MERERILRNVSALLLRLFEVEVPHQEMYDALVETFRFLKEEALTEEEVKNAECLLVMRILNELGYFPEHPLFDTFIGVRKLSKGFVEEFKPHRALALSQINKSLKESHL